MWWEGTNLQKERLFKKQHFWNYISQFLYSFLHALQHWSPLPTEATFAPCLSQLRAPQGNTHPYTKGPFNGSIFLFKFCSVKDQVLQVPSNLKTNIQLTAEFSVTLEEHSDPVLLGVTHVCRSITQKSREQTIFRAVSMSRLLTRGHFASQGGNIDMQKASFCTSSCFCAHKPHLTILATSESLHILCNCSKTIHVNWFIHHYSRKSSPLQPSKVWPLSIFPPEGKPLG